MDMVGVLLALAMGAGLGFFMGQLAGRSKLAGAVARSDYDRVAGELAALSARLADAQARITELDGKLEQKGREAVQANERAVKASTEAQAEARRLEEQKQALEQMHKQMEVKFQNLSSQMLEQMGVKFNTQSEEKLGALLKPMGEQLKGFNELVTKSFGEQTGQQNSLRQEIEKIVLQADSLSKALRGDVKAQGNWGEIMLERILEQSGLAKGTDYTLQGEDMQLKADDGSRQKPDVVVNLPEGKHLIIDSKVSLVAYDRYCSAADDMQRGVQLKAFLASIRGHIVDLAGKAYSDNQKLAAPDFVMLFMPIEGAFSLAVQQDTELHAFAWGKRIALVCPSTLFATLRTVASLWKIEKQNRNAADIAERGAALYDKFVGFVDDMQAIGKQLDAAKGRYDSALNKLSTGAGNVVRQAEMMRELGLKTKKALPKELTMGEDSSVALLDSEKAQA